MNESEKLIKEQFESLPKNVQDVLSSTPWRESARKIGVNKSLTEEQIKSFETETLLILYGFVSPENYLQNLIDSVEVTEEIAEKLADSVGEEIISVIEKKIEEGDKEPQMVVINKPNDVFAGRKEVGEVGEQPTTNNLQQTAAQKINQLATSHLSHETALAFSPVEIESPYSKAELKPITIPSLPDSKPNTATTISNIGSAVESPIPQTENKIKYPGNKDPYREPIE